MDYIEDYQTNNITIEDLSKKYNISQRHIRIIFKIKGIKTKHKHKRKLTLKVDKVFPVFLQDYLENGKSMQHYADKYDVSKFALSKRLEKYFSYRRL